jgi:hypothetical protein
MWWLGMVADLESHSTRLMGSMIPALDLLSPMLAAMLTTGCFRPSTV